MTTKTDIEALVPRVKDEAVAEALAVLLEAVGRLEREVGELRQSTSTQAVAENAGSKPPEVREARKDNLDDR